MRLRDWNIRSHDASVVPTEVESKVAVSFSCSERFSSRGGFVTFSYIESTLDQVALKSQMSAPSLGNGMPQNVVQQQIQPRQPGMHDLQQMIMVSIFLALICHMNFTNLLLFKACKLFTQKPARAKVSQ